MKIDQIFWVLPDKKQEGKLWVINQITQEKISLSAFYEKYAIRDISKAFNIGIPDELLNKFKSENFGFFQLLKLKNNKYILSLSKRCGKDIDNRTVTLTYIGIFNELKMVRLPNVDDINFIKNMDYDITIDEYSKNQFDLMKDESLKDNSINSFSSEVLISTSYKHEWNGGRKGYKKKQQLY